MSTATALDFAFRACESIAFSLHALIGLSDPATGAGAVKYITADSLPRWFTPL